VAIRKAALLSGHITGHSRSVRLQNPLTRWQFALVCMRVVLFPPRRGGLLQIMMNNRTKYIITAFGAPALMSLILVVPFAFLELRYNTETSHNLIHFPLPLFGILWFLGTVFLITVAQLVRTVYAGDSLLAHPGTLLLRLALLACVAWIWGIIIIDQLPCFLGVPNCD
jgi:hypothetical protein